MWSVSLSNGAVAELGAEWIEREDDALRALASELGRELLPAGVDYRRREAFGSLAATLAEQERALDAARRARAAVPEARAATSTLGEFLATLPVDERARATLRARLQGTCAADLDAIALRHAGEHAFRAGSGRYWRTAGGNQSIAQAAAERLPDVRLGHRVRGVRWDDGSVQVAGVLEDGAGFRVEGRAAVVAVPASLVAEIAFSPGLPEAQARALRELPMGVASKLAVPLADEPTARARMDVDVPYWCWAALGEGGRARRAVTAFAGSPQAQRALGTDVPGADPDAWLGRVLALNPDVRPAGPPALAAWAVDPLARGCYAAFDNRSEDRRDLLRRPHGPLAFAGEHTAIESSGTMNAAVQSGARAAAEVLAGS